MGYSDPIFGLQMYTISTSLLSGMSVALAYVHNRVIDEAHETRVQSLERDRRRRAPPGTIERLQTRKYNMDLFGDEKQFPAECPICLSTWSSMDEIKITPCQHAFHTACLRDWLATARTCALCRQDVVPCGGPPRPAREAWGTE